MADIISYCHIRNKEIWKDGERVFSFRHGSLDEFLQAAFDHLQPGYPKFYKMDRLCQFGFLASEVLISSIQLPETTALVLSNASSSLDTDSRFWETVKSQASPSLFVYTLPNIVIGEISIRHKLKGESVFFISPQFDPQLNVGYVD